MIKGVITLRRFSLLFIILICILVNINNAYANPYRQGDNSDATREIQDKLINGDRVSFDDGPNLALATKEHLEQIQDVDPQWSYDELISDLSYRRLRNYLFVAEGQTPNSVYLKMPMADFHNYICPYLRQQGWDTYLDQESIDLLHPKNIDDWTSELKVVNYNSLQTIKWFGHPPKSLPTEMLAFEFGTDNDSMLNRLTDIRYTLILYGGKNTAYAFRNALKREAISRYGAPDENKEYVPKLDGKGIEVIKKTTWMNNGVLRSVTLSAESHMRHYIGDIEDHEVADDETTYLVTVIALVY